ncbi:hypothetical protein CLV51_102668 [Chitinophaga niastensis]|uniref:Uncharacterized protein n=1 Tax=Chitinophaga niastensis TaxID=536980 RepID=A0A2P8HNK8_CHINA|nr:hypothetical protein [Chitinophaga niastensis]PSL47808.1 hypothetical protein CLV51_102668 [Chitinophaga niastensis]
MYGEAKKLHLIEEILKIESDAVLEEVETVIAKNKTEPARRRDFNDFAVMMSAEEAAAFEKIIEDGCEQINPNDWK